MTGLRARTRRAERPASKTASRPRVLVVGQGPPTTGGIPTFVRQLVDSEWLGAQVDLEFFNTTPTATKRPGALHPSNGVFALRDAYALFSRAGTADIVHLNLAAAPTLPLVRAILLSAAAKARGAKVVLHAHTGRLQACVKSPSYRLLLRVARLVVERFVVVSRNAETAARPILDRKVIRQENGIDVERFEPSSQPAAEVLITYVGTVCERKGLLDFRDALLLLTATPQRRRVEVVIIGDSRQEGPGVFERMREAFADARLPPVKFTGAISPEKVAEYLRRTSIFCLPSHWEGFPISLLEAMAAGTAIVATNVGDIPWMLDGGRAGLIVEPQDPSGLAGAIGELVDDPEKSADLARRARMRAEDAYSLDTMVKATYDLYSAILAHSK